MGRHVLSMLRNSVKNKAKGFNEQEAAYGFKRNEEDLNEMSPDLQKV
jgi:hypothetical protein